MYYHADSFVERINWLGGSGLLSFPILVPMWYIRDLMVLCLMAPVLWLICNGGKLSRYLFFTFITVIYVTAIYPFVPGLSPGPLLFFSLGAVFSLREVSPFGFFMKIHRPVAILFLLLWILVIPLAGYRTTWGNYFYPWFIITGVITIINLFVMLNGKSEIVKKTESASTERPFRERFMEFCRKHEADVFFIYAAHIFFVSYVNDILFKICAILTDQPSAQTIAFADAHPLMLIICYLLKITVVIVVCLIISKFINRYMPRTGVVLTGR